MCYGRADSSEATDAGPTEKGCSLSEERARFDAVPREKFRYRGEPAEGVAEDERGRNCPGDQRPG